MSEESCCQNSILGGKKEHAQRNWVCACLPIHLKPEFLLGSAYLIADFLSKLYLGDAAFVTEMQKRIGREKDDLNIPQLQKRPIAKHLSAIAAQHKDRKAAIIAAYKTGAYSQREIGEYYQLHPITVGVIVRKNKNLNSVSDTSSMLKEIKINQQQDGLHHSREQ